MLLNVLAAAALPVQYCLGGEEEGVRGGGGGGGCYRLRFHFRAQKRDGQLTEADLGEGRRGGCDHLALHCHSTQL